MEKKSAKIKDLPQEFSYVEDQICRKAKRNASVAPGPGSLRAFHLLSIHLHTNKTIIIRQPLLFDDRVKNTRLGL